jgi:hypothetical protein
VGKTEVEKVKTEVGRAGSGKSEKQKLGRCELEKLRRYKLKWEEPEVGSRKKKKLGR